MSIRSSLRWCYIAVTWLFNTFWSLMQPAECFCDSDADHKMQITTIQARCMHRHVTFKTCQEIAYSRELPEIKPNFPSILVIKTLQKTLQMSGYVFFCYYFGEWSIHSTQGSMLWKKDNKRRSCFHINLWFRCVTLLHGCYKIWLPQHLTYLGDFNAKHNHAENNHANSNACAKHCHVKHTHTEQYC